eukprot:COSAG06_NODE_1309_length_9914_cov_2.941722_5_plen_57_part_00
MQACKEFLECLEDEEPTSGLQRERERFGDSGSAATKVFLSFSLWSILTTVLAPSAP